MQTMSQAPASCKWIEEYNEPLCIGFVVFDNIYISIETVTVLDTL